MWQKDIRADAGDVKPIQLNSSWPPASSPESAARPMARSRVAEG